MRARVMTFHVDPDDMPAVMQALDAARERFEHDDSFKGMLCLEEDGLRNQLVIVTLWEGAGLDASADEAEEAKTRIASATDTGVTSRTYDVLRIGLVGREPGGGSGGVPQDGGEPPMTAA